MIASEGGFRVRGAEIDREMNRKVDGFFRTRQNRGNILMMGWNTGGCLVS
jgi:hypothetical protein